MQYAPNLLISVSLVVLAVAQGAAAQTDPASKSSRDAIIKSALAKERGEITAIEAALRDGGGVYLGFSSGALVNCAGERPCRHFDGTPSSDLAGAVRGLAVTLNSGSEIVWVTYPHGVLYRCAENFCREVEVPGEGRS